MSLEGLEGRDIISIHIGQAGVQEGSAIWELLTAEHEFTPDGISMYPERAATDLTFRSFYNHTPSDHYVPRALFIDLEPSVLDEIRVGPYRSLFHPDQLVNGMEDAANNFSRGYYTAGKTVLAPFINSLRKSVEAADRVQGFLLSTSMGGGTGGGMGALILEHISANYPKTSKLSLNVAPSPNLVTCMVEPYNAILTAHYNFDHTDVNFIADNESLYDICHKNLSIHAPTYGHLNRIMAQLWSAITVSFRFDGPQNCDLTTLQTNLVPYPRIHFPIINYAPIINRNRANHSLLTCEEITRSVFETESQLIRLDINNGKYMAASLLYRGEVSPCEVHRTLNMLKTKDMSFVDWCPTGFKIGINNMPPTVIANSRIAPTSRNVTLLTNNTAIGVAWERLNHKATLLYTKRAFVHWFVGDGMEEGEISDAMENIHALVADYNECVSHTFTSEDDED